MTKKEILNRIASNCVECMYDSTCPGTKNKQVENCKITQCQFWELRPLTEKGKYQRRRDKFVSMTVDEQLRIKNKVRSIQKNDVYK